MTTTTESRPIPRVRNLRRFCEWTEEELAELLGVGVETVREWEKGKATIPDDATAWMVGTFGVSARHLLGWDLKHRLPG